MSKQVIPGALFGWDIKTGSDTFPLYHIGVILEVTSDPKEYKVLHYGANNEPKIRIESLLDAVKRVNAKKVCFNTTTIVPPERLEWVDNTVHMSYLNMKYTGEYSLTKNNCQNFIRDCFILNISTQSDCLSSGGITTDLMNALFLWLSGNSIDQNEHTMLRLKLQTVSDLPIVKWNKELTIDTSSW